MALIKILITGAYATGKTTLVEHAARALSRQGVAAALRADVARWCPFPLNREQTFDASLWIAAEQIRLEVLGGAPELQVLLCDRGPADVLSHTPAKLVGDASRAILLKVADAWMSTYDMILMAQVDSTREIEDDGLRVLDRNYQLLLQSELTSALAELRCDYRPLPADDRARIDCVVEAIAGAQGVE